MLSFTYIHVIIFCVLSSLVQLQEEKERQFLESRAAFDEMVRSKDYEIQTLQNKMASLTRDLDTKNEVSRICCTYIYVHVHVGLQSRETL